MPAARSSYAFAHAPHPQHAATMLGGATAGMLARIPCHPIDTVKARIQGNARAGLRAVLASLRSEGIAGFYRGFPVTFIGSAPASMLYFSSYELCKAHLPAVVPALGAAPESATHFVAGMLAETVSCVLWVPIDVVKERLQVQQRLATSGGGGTADGFYYRSTTDAVRQVRAGPGGRGWLRRGSPRHRRGVRMLLCVRCIVAPCRSCATRASAASTRATVPRWAASGPSPRATLRSTSR
jgi:hypothetical protein